MNLDEIQRNKVAAWLADGLKLSEIQTRLASEFGIRMTYMEVRLLVDDLRLTPKDADLPKPASVASDAPGPNAPKMSLAKESPAISPKPGGSARTGMVSVTVDQIARPGAVVSGKVTFSDGNIAEWYLDQTGRLGLVPEQAGYRPPNGDVQQFQLALQARLSELGL